MFSIGTDWLPKQISKLNYNTPHKGYQINDCHDDNSLEDSPILQYLINKQPILKLAMGHYCVCDILLMS